MLAVALIGWRVAGSAGEPGDPAPLHGPKHARVAVERRHPAPRPQAEPPRTEARRTEPRRTEPRRTEPGPEPELTALLRTLEPEERQELRDLVREEKWAETEARLYAYAETSGWDDALTEEVRGILEQTTTGVSARLHEIDAGAVTWEELEPELREFRLVQANRLRDTLGDPGFLALAEGMDFWHPPAGAQPRRAPRGPAR